MAILDALPGLSVSVCVDGQALTEFEDDEAIVPSRTGAIGDYQAARTVTKYIEAASDKEFTVNIFLLKGFKMDCPWLSVPVYVDGKLAQTPLIREPNPNNQWFTPCSRVIDGTYVAAPGKPDDQFIKPFKFCKIETTIDDDKLKSVKDDAKLVSKVGDITIKVYRTSEGVRNDPDLADIPSESLQTKVHEKALKGDSKSHSISYGAATKLVKKSYFKTEKLDGEDYPLAIFKFKYRSRDALKSLLIIERTPSPEPERLSASPSPPPIDLNNLNAAQKRQVARMLNDMNRSRNSSTPTIKRERADNGGEGSSKRRKSGKKITIDLTEDSDEENILPMN